MSQRRTLFRNILSNYIALTVQMGVRIIQLGFFVRAFGESGMGLFTLLLAIPSISQIAGYSLSKGTVRFMSAALARDDQPAANGFFNSAFVGFTGLTFIAVLLVFFGRPFLAHFVDVPTDLWDEVQVSLLIVAAGMLVTMPPVAIQGACQAMQRYDLIAGARTVSLLLQLGLCVAAFAIDRLTIPLTLIIIFATRVLECVLWWFIAKQAMPAIRLSYRAVNRSAMSAILLFSGSAILIDVGNIVGYDGYKVLLSAFLDLKLLGAYGVFATIVAAVATISYTGSQVLVPVAATYDATDNKERLERLFYFGTKMTVLVGFAVVILPLPALPWLLRRGLSDMIASEWPSCAVLLIGQVFVTGGIISATMLAGIGRQREQVYLTLAWVSVGTVGSIILFLAGCRSLFWPLLLVSAARAIAGLCLGEVGRRIFGSLGFLHFWWQAFGLPAVVTILSIGIALSLHYSFPALSDSTWFHVLIAAIELACFASLCWFGALSRDERREFSVMRMLRKSNRPVGDLA